ncbi:Serine-threonine/tyrosine-protein kinase, catalytic domain [Sesbania bispinosa]|nr:Serine-threonine/tyrosine-protein kinase, catalytic domain [Sesbania bispinosa]
MGCFTIFMSKKKKSDQNQIMHLRRASLDEHVPTALPEPQTLTQSSRSSRGKSIHPINNFYNNRTRALSAPSSLAAAEQNAPASFENEEQERPKCRTRSLKEQQLPVPQPLPLPTPKNGGASKAINSHKSGLARGSKNASGSALDAAEQVDLASNKYEEGKKESKQQAGAMKEQHLPNPQPCPLPYPQGGALKATGNFKLGMPSFPLYASGSFPLPSTGPLRYFLYEEIAAACHNFSSDQCMAEGLSSTIYKASFADNHSTSKEFEATITRLNPSTQGLRDFLNEVNILASLQHPNLCKLLGFHVRDGSEPRMLVFERLCHGSLDRLLFGRSDAPSIDWNTRMKISFCAAQGLNFLHEQGPFQTMYNEFSTANIQIDNDFNAKLSGYGCVGHIPGKEISSRPLTARKLSLETLEREMLNEKNNVWSFGIVLLELLTGRKNLDTHHPKEERDLIKWTKPFLADDFRLPLIMDPQLKGHFPSRAVRVVADIVQRCLQKEPSDRPNMRTIVEHLKVIQNMKYCCWFPLQEPAGMPRKEKAKSPSFDGITSHAPTSSFPPSSSSVARPSSSPPRWAGVPTPLPSPCGCSSTPSIGEPSR